VNDAAGHGDGRREVVDAHHHLLDVAGVGYSWIQERSPVLEALLADYYDCAHDYGCDDYTDDMSTVVVHAVRQHTFGPERCMFATHLPVDGLLWSVEALVDALSEILVDLADHQQDEFFGGCARRQYRVP
jgi:predicted TIM-barrel fold metal-dependent hydrolase